MAEPKALHPPRVTIGLPVFNGAEFIGRTLDSVLAQTYGDFELVVSDNASTDDTVAIVEGYAGRDARIRLVREAKNRGATYNYNRVLALARGAYFKWLAADDVIRPEFLEKTVAALDADPALDFVYTRAAFIDAADRVIYSFDDVMTLPPWPAAAAPRVRQMLAAILTDGSAANVIIFGLGRTPLFQRIRPLGNYFGPDFTVVTDMALHGRLLELPEILAFYRRHAKSTSTYHRPNAAQQQAFLDPTITNRLVQEFQLRRRYLEIGRAILRAPLAPAVRLPLLGSLGWLFFRRSWWRMRYELRLLLGRQIDLREVVQYEGIGRHWLEFNRTGKF